MCDKSRFRACLPADWTDLTASAPGCEQRCLHDHDPQLPSSTCQHALNAKVDFDHISPGNCNLSQLVTTIQPSNPFQPQWLPWILRMSRPGRPLTKKSIQLQVILSHLIHNNSNEMVIRLKWRSWRREIRAQTRCWRMSSTWTMTFSLPEGWGCLLLFKLLRKMSYFLPHFVKSGTLEIQDKVVARVPSRHVFQVVRCIRLC